MDKKAKRILFSTYWKNGWIDKKDRNISREDFEYAKSKGLMFDSLSISHDECVERIVELVDCISQHSLAKAFLSSLTARRLDWRSSLSSYAIASNIPKHKYDPQISGTSYENGQPVSHHYTCGICRDAQYGVIGNERYTDEDLNVLNFERIKWGGVRHGELLYTYFDLTQFQQADIPEPSDEDIACFEAILDVIAGSAPNDYPSALEKRLAPVVKSNKAEREVLIEILASIGVLKPASYDRSLRGKGDWVFAEYWRGEDGFCKTQVQQYFGAYLNY